MANESTAAAKRTRRLHDQRGQALIETAIVIVILTTLAMGAVEFGRAFMIVNMVTQAARAGARAASTAPTTNRDSSGIIVDESPYSALVDSEIRTVLGPDTDLLTIDVDQAVSNGVPTVSVNVAGTLPYIFNLVSNTFDVDRTITFRDEGR